MQPMQSFLDVLSTEAEARAEEETDFRRQIASRTKELERQRSFAFRRLNLMRSVAEVITGAESEEIAVAAGGAVLRAKLGGLTTARRVPRWSRILHRSHRQSSRTLNHQKAKTKKSRT